MRRPWDEPPLESVYLDWNATTPPHPAVLEAMACAAARTWANPSSVHAEGRRARAVLDALREALGGALAVHPRDVILTSGGTEANNLALNSAPGLVTSRLEHPSIVAVAERVQSLGRPVRWLPVPPSGRVEPESFDDVAGDLPPGSVLAVQAVNHETGVIQRLGELGERARRAGLGVHVDAVQSFGKLTVEGLELATSVAVAAHKIRGPKGIGALAFRGRPPPPLVLGGAQEGGLRAGTADVVAAAGFLVAVELAQDAPQRWKALAPLRDELERAFAGLALVNGEGPRAPHVTNVSFRAARGDELVAALDLLGVRVSSGSACSAGTAEASPVITAMLGKERALGAVRFSLGEGVTSDQVSFTRTAVFRALGVAARDLQ